MGKKIESKRREKDENGRAVINMTVKNDDSFLSAFSTTDAPIISSEVAEFLENSVENILPTEKLALCIHNSCIDSKEENLYRKGIKEYYSEKYISNEQKLKHNKMLVSLFGLVGVLILALAVYIGYHYDSPVWTEVIDIVAWVFVWEAVDIGAFQNRTLRVNRMRYHNLANMDVKFLDINKDIF